MLCLCLYVLFNFWIFLGMWLGGTLGWSNGVVLIGKNMDYLSSFKSKSNVKIKAFVFMLFDSHLAFGTFLGQCSLLIGLVWQLLQTIIVPCQAPWLIELVNAKYWVSTSKQSTSPVVLLIAIGSPLLYATIHFVHILHERNDTLSNRFYCSCRNM